MLTTPDMEKKITYLEAQLDVMRKRIARNAEYMRAIPHFGVTGVLAALASYNCRGLDDFWDYFWIAVNGMFGWVYLIFYAFGFR